jgi:ketosteroid isomerase-like protein
MEAALNLKPLALLSALALAALAWPATAAPTPRAVVEAKFAAVNRHDIDGIVALYAPDARLTAPDFCSPRQGRAEVERTYRAIFALVPDARVNVQEYLAQDDRVAVRFRLSSAVPGRAFAIELQDFFTVRNGLIVRDDGMFDNRGRPCKP